jgi:DNA-binding NarL/FixJ family response regulator
MLNHKSHEESTPKQKIKLLALLESDVVELGSWPTSAVGFMVQGHDTGSLIRAIQSLVEGTPSGSAPAKRVRITIHEENEGGEEQQLSPREHEVLCALVKGLSYKMIAHELNISFETVRSHVKGIYAKMKVNNNTAAVAKAIHSGLAVA